MRCRHTFPSGVALAVVVSALSASPQQTADDRFLAVEQAWMNALAGRDTVTLEAMLAPEFTIIGAGSPADAPVGDRAEWLQNAGRFPWPRHDVRLIRVHDMGDTAVVHCVLTGEYPPKSITPEGGVLTFLVTDVWVKRSAGWQVLSRHASLAAPKR